MEPLNYSAIPQVSPDESAHTTIHFASAADGSIQTVEVYSPPGKRAHPLPLVIAPHPITWTAGEDYHGGPAGLSRGYHRGYRHLAARNNLLIAMPHGHQRSVENASLAYPAHMADLASLAEVLEGQGFLVDRTRIYACGLSMGGLEALVLAGRYPELLAALVAFNPIVDLAAWQEDMENSPLPEIKEFRTAENIAREVGGRPAQVPHLYRERSVFPYLAGIVQVPVLIFWSGLDIIVPRQRERHSYALYLQAKALAPDCPLAEVDHTHLHGSIDPTEKNRWRLHEWCDYEWALQWLLQHRKTT